MDTLHTGKPEKQGLRPRKFVQYNLLPVIIRTVVVWPSGRDLRRHQFESTSAVNFACNPRMAGCAPTRRRVIAATHRHGVRAGVGTCPRPRNSLTVTDFGGVDIGIHQAMRRSYGDATNNRDNGVVEAFGGAPPALVFPRRRRLPGREVPTTTPTHGSATGKHRVLGRCLLCLNGQGLGCPVCAHFVHYTSRRNRVPPRRGFRVEVQ